VGERVREEGCGCGLRERVVEGRREGQAFTMSAHLSASGAAWIGGGGLTGYDATVLITHIGWLDKLLTGCKKRKMYGVCVTNLS
jgi:hypothetical protein